MKKETKQHWDFASIARSMLESRRGYPDATGAEAAVRLLEQKDGALAGAALLELLRIIRTVAKAVLEEPDEVEKKEDWDSPPEYAAVIPDLKPGDILYSACDGITEPIRREVVIHVLESGHALTVGVGKPWGDEASVSWASKDDFRTMEEAVKHGIASDDEYYSKQMKKVKQAAKDLAGKKNLSKYLGRPKDDED